MKKLLVVSCLLLVILFGCGQSVDSNTRPGVSNPPANPLPDVPPPDAPPINNPPVITSLNANPATIFLNGLNRTSLINCSASDSDGDTLAYIWTASGGIINGTGSSITWFAPQTAMSYQVTCKVSDGRAEVSDQVIIAVAKWLIPAQLANSFGRCDKVMDEAVFEGKLYLVWVAGDLMCIGFDQAYLSIFDSNTIDAVELLRKEFLNYNYTRSVAVDLSGIYVELSKDGGSSVLKALDLNANEKWLFEFRSYCGRSSAADIKIREGYIYITGDVFFQAPGFISAGNEDVLVGKFDTNGNLIWLSQWGTTCIDYGKTIEIREDGLYATVEAGFCSILPHGYTTPAYQGKIILKYDFNGSLLNIIE